MLMIALFEHVNNNLCMTYRGNRFEVGELKGLGMVFEAIDTMEAQGLTLVDEVMAGKSHRRRLHKDAIQSGVEPNYLLQATFSPPEQEGKRYITAYLIEESNRLLGEMVLPGIVEIDKGGINGFNEMLPGHAFGSTGRTEDDMADVYMPWLRTQWTEGRKNLMFYCGILPPKTRRFLDDYPQEWDTKSMRSGLVVFTPSPVEMQAH